MNLRDPYDIPDRALPWHDDEFVEQTEPDPDEVYDRMRDDELLKGIEDTAGAQSLKKLWDAELPALLKRQAGDRQ